MLLADLAWTSFLGGTDRDYGDATAIDASGNAWVVGHTNSSDFATAGFDLSYNGGEYDAFISKINADGTLAWSSYLGGTNRDYGSGIAIDSSGNAWVTGYTHSEGWAVGGFDTTYNTNGDAFVAKINSNGTLAWSSYLGGAGLEAGNGIAIDGSGNAWLTGLTWGGGWAVGGFDTSQSGLSDAFVAKINADGTFAWSSYLGGTSDENEGDFDAGGIAIDASGNAWVTGWTESTGWAVGGFDTSYNGGDHDGFVAKVNANGTLAWVSYLGGTGEDRGRGIALDGAGNAWVTGDTVSSGWTVGGFDTSFNGYKDAFIAKIDADGTLDWSSYLGGPNIEFGKDIAIDESGSAWLTGSTDSLHWAAGGFDISNNGSQDTYVSKINADGTLDWTSLLGGVGSQFGYDIAFDGAGNAWVTGWTSASGWAVGGFDTTKNGEYDAFISKITIIDITAPVVTAASYSYTVARNKLRVTFTEDVSINLSATDLIVTTVPGGAPVNVTNYTYNSATNSATFDLLTPVQDGNYSARLPAGSVSDLVGHPLAADYAFDFFILTADANRDRKVNAYDLWQLATNWLGTGMAFTQGDFNYDTIVNAADLGILGTHWQVTLPEPATLSPPVLPTTISTRVAARKPTRIIQVISEPQAGIV